LLQLQPKISTLESQGVQVYIVASGSENDVKAYFQQNPIDATIVPDYKSELFRLYQVSATPTNVYVKKTGEVHKTEVGWVGSVAPMISTLQILSH
jgi:thioredoxin-related protein